MNNLIMLKWGGSLITDKDKPLTVRRDVIYNLANQLKEFINRKTDVPILLGHGSGSFGHSVANRYKTRSGVFSREEWIGFSKVWQAARQLNTIVTDILQDVGIPCFTFAPSTFILASKGLPASFSEEPLKKTLQEKFIIPVVHGDVIFDDTIGGTILSTEDIFLLLAKSFKPNRILLAGIEPYVWQDYPTRRNPVRKITIDNYETIRNKITGSSSIDVTGGMLEKTRLMMQLVKNQPGLVIRIFSGEGQTNLSDALMDKDIGTTIEAE